MMALLLNISEQDEIIIPSYTFVSTANAFAKYGAKIITVDSLDENPNIDPNEIEKNINKNTKAVCIVHYSGVSCDMDQIIEICNKNNIILLEDAAQCINSYYKDIPLGSFGAMSAFSFHETKNINCGEGGLLVINDNKYLDRAHIIREKGTNRTKFINGEIDKYQWIDIGSSYLLSDINAAYLYPQILDIDEITNKRKKIWKLYHQTLSKNNNFIVCNYYEGMNFHIFYLLFDNNKELNDMKKNLISNNILPATHYVPLHKSDYYLNNYENLNLPNSEKFHKTLLRLPLHYNLTENEVSHICDIIKNKY